MCYRHDFKSARNGGLYNFPSKILNKTFDQNSIHEYFNSCDFHGTDTAMLHLMSNTCILSLVNSSCACQPQSILLTSRDKFYVQG